MSENTAPEVPEAGDSQTEPLVVGKHSQIVLLNVDDAMYEIRWDGKALRLLLPQAANLETGVISYKVLGHMEADLPFPLEMPTFERQARIIVYTFLNPESSEDDAPAATD